MTEPEDVDLSKALAIAGKRSTRASLDIMINTRRADLDRELAELLPLLDEATRLLRDRAAGRMPKIIEPEH